MGRFSRLHWVGNPVSSWWGVFPESWWERGEEAALLRRNKPQGIQMGEADVSQRLRSLKWENCLHLPLAFLCWNVRSPLGLRRVTGSQILPCKHRIQHMFKAAWPLREGREMDTPLSARTTFLLLQHKGALVCEGSCLHNTAMGYETLPPSPLFPPNCHPRRKIVMCPPWLRDRAADPAVLGGCARLSRFSHSFSCL